MGKRPKIVSVLIPCLSLCLVWLLSNTFLYQRVDYWVNDQQQARVADERCFLDILVLDIDDTSIHNLKSEYSMWPYDRDIYGLVLDYLTEMGAKTVVFDILFLEHRSGDDVFTESICRNKNAVFAMREPTYWSGFQVDLKKNEELLTDLSWSVSKDFPTAPVKMVLLPVTEFIELQSSGYNLGSVDIKSDMDGIVRRIPYVYEVDSKYIPSLPVVVHGLHKEQHQIDYNPDKHLVQIGEDAWSMDEKGLMSIYFPKNKDFLLSLPFYEVVRAARGEFKPDDAEFLFKGKTVYIGSTAFNSDKIQTPRGMMSGTSVLALIQQNLKFDLILKPSSTAWSILWVFFACLILLLTVFCKGYCPWKYGSLVLTSMVAIIYFNGMVLASQNQPSTLLFPLLTVFFGYGFYVIFFGMLLKQQNVLLLEEKNELELVNEALETEANTDTLTGMLNRRAYLSLFEHEIERYKRTGVTFCVGIMDLDFFKKVNDTYGHDIGDDVLRNCADVLKKSKRELDVVARWGGEEFVIFFPETGVEGTEIALNKIRVVISKIKHKTPQGDLRVTMSIGMAEFNDLAMSPERCIAKADKALYQAKEDGRNRVCFRE